MVIAFLEAGKKIMDCSNLIDVTNQVSCKAISGADQIKLHDKQDSSSLLPPGQCPGFCNIPETTMTSNPVVQCKCQEGRTCITTIKSNAFEHTVTCGSKTVKKQCGGPLLGTKRGILIDIEKYAHPLCTEEKTYVTLIKDMEWSCRDLLIKPCDICPGSTPPVYPPVPCPSPTTTVQPVIVTTGPPPGRKRGRMYGL